MSSSSSLQTAACLFAAFVSASCGVAEVSDRLRLEDLQVSVVGPVEWLPGTTLTVTGKGFLVAALGNQVLKVSVGELTRDVPMSAPSDTTLTAVLTEAVLADFPRDKPLDARLVIRRTLTENGQTDQVTTTLAVRVVSNITPKFVALESPGLPKVYPGDAVGVTGKGFLLPGEGKTFLRLQGTRETFVPPESRPLTVEVEARPGTRDRVELVLRPSVLGIRPGRFLGKLTIENRTPAGTTKSVEVADVTLDLEAPFIESVEPKVAARGQRIRATGRGLLATDAVRHETTLFLLEGEFTRRKTSTAVTLAGATALSLFPDAFTGSTSMEYVLRVTQLPSGEQTGLGLLAGSFKGTVSPLVVVGPETLRGAGAKLELTIALQRQIIFVSFLPGFSQTLAEMGLGRVEADIKKHTLEAARVLYQGINVEFRDVRPTDFAEYSVIEVGGADPNGQGLFGLDNTAGKDIDNIRFNDIIGGTNAESAEQGYYAFGGVFARSFLELSPTLGKEKVSIQSARFDDIFRPFMTALEGTPVVEADLSPGAPRRVLLDEAIRVLGNLVGGTVAHEIGHSLGCAAVEGEYHHPGDNDLWLMDSGSNRPFAERVGIDGQGPEEFGPVDRPYLERILPMD